MVPNLNDTCMAQVRSQADIRHMCSIIFVVYDNQVLEAGTIRKLACYQGSVLCSTTLHVVCDSNPPYRYTGTASVILCCLMWFRVYLSNPGLITKDNVSFWLAADPPGDDLYPTRDCSTCELPKPARSKHCSLCKGCIAREDHHCTTLSSPDANSSIMNSLFKLSRFNRSFSYSVSSECLSREAILVQCR